jgi:hypothetical protein
VLVLKGRVPPWQDLVPVFAVCVLITFSWSIIWFLYKLPSWLSFLSGWSILAILAYGLVFAFLESVAFLLFLVILAILLPRQWLGVAFKTYGTLIILMLTFWLGLIQSLSTLRLWSDVRLMTGLFMVLTTVVIASILVRRSTRLCTAISTLAERSTILLYVYIPLSVVSLVIVVARNVL